MGITLPKPVMTKVFERFGNDTYRVGCASVNGYRESMEDAHIIWMTGSTGFFGVFDGHVNDKCSEFLATEWRKRLAQVPLPMSDEKMKELALSIDQEWLDTEQDGGSTGTFFAAYKTNERNVHLQVGNVGDSRVIVCQGGRCRPMTEDHKPMNDGEYRRILECGGRVENCRVDGSLAVSRAFGDRDYKQFPAGQLQQKVIALADVTHTDVTFGGEDFAALCCDGVFESNFSNEEVIEFIRTQLQTCKDLAVVAGRVCEEAVIRGSRDNISCVIVQFQNGSDYAALPQPYEVVPGPFSAPRNAPFRRMYQTMARKGHMDIQTALDLRYAELRAIAQPTTEIIDELEGFRPFPGVELNAEQRLKWFADFWEDLNKERGQNTRADHLQRFQLLQQQVGVPLPVLLSLMSGDDASGN